MIPITRKRSRSSEEEDFLPLSKKINNLHINQWRNQDMPELPLHNVPHNVANVTHTPPDWPPSYAPDLNRQDNPYYYEPNKVLFDLYLARVHRTNY